MSNNKPASPTTLITNFKQTLKIINVIFIIIVNILEKYIINKNMVEEYYKCQMVLFIWDILK
jgi:hypothetical protein